MNNLNCKMQAHAKLCEENIELEVEEKTTIETILKDHKRRVERHIKTMLSRMIHHSIKVLIIW